MIVDVVQVHDVALKLLSKAFLWELLLYMAGTSGGSNLFTMLKNVIASQVEGKNVSTKYKVLNKPTPSNMSHYLLLCIK